MSTEALFAGRFELHERRGAGMNGVVWRARDTTSGEQVALKILHERIPVRVARFSREARILARLDHARIARHRGHGVSETREPWLAMEWLEGETLAERLRQGPLTLADAVRVARGIAEGLAAAHAMEIVHRDVKPSNLFLVGSDPGAVKILDFGVARRRGSMTRTLTITDAFVGTLSTIAPEQIFGARDVGGRADVYSLGCVLFECVSGRSPLEGRTATEMISKIVGATPPRLSELDPSSPPELDALVASMLEKSVFRRPDAKAVIAALDALALGPQAETRARAGLRISREERRPVCVVAVRSEGELPIDAAAARERGRVLQLGVDAALVWWRHPLSELRRARRFALALPDDCRVAVAIGLGSESRERLAGEVVERAIAALGDPSLPRVSFDRESGRLLAPPGELRGRERELAALLSLRERCESDGGRAIALVIGEAGIGKSALAGAVEGADVVEDVDELDRLEDAEAWLRGEGAGLRVATARDPSPGWRALASSELRLRPLSERAASEWVGRERSLLAEGIPALLALAEEQGEPACALERSPYFSLDEATRRALRALAIAGDPRDLALLSAIIDEDAAPLLRAAADAGALDADHRFASPLVRAAARAALTAVDRRIGSRVAAEHLESREAPDAEAIARLLLDGELPARALAWLGRAARAALSGGDPERAIASVERAVSLAPPAAARGELLAIRGRAELELARFDDAAAHLDDACDLLIAGTEPWYAAITDAARARRARKLDLAPLRRRAEREPPARGAEAAREACLAALSEPAAR